MHDSWRDIVALTDGMVLGAATWLEPLARNTDLAYGMAHRPEALFASAWYTLPGQGVITIWEGETVYDPQHDHLNFSAWVSLPAADASTPYAHLEIYYADAWHVLAAEDTLDYAGWFDEEHCGAGSSEHDKDGVVSYDISAWYQPGDIVHARLVAAGDGNTGVTTGQVYRACLGGFAPEWPDNTAIAWPDPFPTWQEVTPHAAADFNALRDAAEYLRQCAERPVLGEAVATMSHLQGEATLIEGHWTFRKSGCDKLTCVIESSQCDDDNYVVVFCADEQYPHGPNGGTTSAVTGTPIKTNTTTTLSYDMSALTTGEYYSILVGTQGTAVAGVTSLHVADLAGAAPTYQPGSFAHKQIPTADDLQTIGDALAEMEPVGTAESPLWYEHTFNTFTPFSCDVVLPTGKWVYEDRRWRFWHTFSFLRWRGAGRIISSDGINSYNLSNATAASGPQLLDLRSLAWLAEGDWYYVEDTEDGEILVAYEDWRPELISSGIHVD